ncbi:MAG: DUF882 domain-containing protein [Elusimicrobiales bacterium]|jgi:uncharacterized protein YcbK (DUF882 family)
MRRNAGFTALLLLFHGSGVYAQSGGEISASALMERLPSMIGEMPDPPKVTEADVVELEEGDPETYIFIHSKRAHPPKPVNLGGDGVLTLTRLDSGEHLAVRYRSAKGAYNPAAFAKIRRLMRCSLTGKETEISIKLVEILDAVEDRFEKRGLTFLSGYRTPRLNSRVSGAARRSLHMLGWAADIRVPGHSPAKVAAYAGKIGAGGVGYYPDMSFTHLDVGPARHWTVRRPRRQAAEKPQGIPQK